MNATSQSRAARGSPWVGTSAFTEEDWGRFFGRQREIGELADLWQQHRLTILVGDSGVGKTSLLRAGVIRRLRDNGVRVLPIGDIGGGFREIPAPAMVRQSPYVTSLLASWQRSDVPAQNSSLGLTEFLSGQDQYSQAGTPTLVAVDQLHHLPAGPERLRLLHRLAEAAKSSPGIHLLLSVRTADLPDLDPVQEALGPASPFVLRPLDRNAAIDALVQPTVGSAVTFGTGVAGRLVDELSSSPDAGTAVEPFLLQLAADAVWNDLPATDKTVSLWSLPDMEHTLAAYCVPVLDAITSEHGMQTCEVGTWIRRTFFTGDPPNAVRRTAALADMPESVLDALESRYLLQPVRRDRQIDLEIRHPLLAGALRKIPEIRQPAQPSDPTESLMNARLAISADELPTATRHAQAALRASGSDRRTSAEAQSLLGDIAFRRRRVDDAKEHYRVAAEEYAFVGDLHQASRLLAAIGRLLMQQGDHQGAMEKLSAAAYRAPGDPFIQIGLAQIFWVTGSTQSALMALDKMLRESGPGNLEARLLRGEMRADLGRSEAALEDLAHVDRDASGGLRAARLLAVALRDGGMTSLDDLDEIVEAAPRSGPVLLRAARVCALSGDADRAARLATRARAAEEPPLPTHQRRLAESLITVP